MYTVFLLPIQLALCMAFAFVFVSGLKEPIEHIIYEHNIWHVDGNNHFGNVTASY